MTNLLLIPVLLLTNPIPVEVTMPTRDIKIERRLILERRITTHTNESGSFFFTTNDFVKGEELTKSVRTEIWTRVPLLLTDLKPYPPLPFSPGSTKQ